MLHWRIQRTLWSITSHHLILLFLILLTVSADAQSVDNQRLHLVSDNLIGEFYWHEPGTCLEYRLIIFAKHNRTDGPTPEIMLPFPDQQLSVVFSFNDRCNSTSIVYTFGSLTNFSIEFDGGLRTGRLVAKSIPLLTAGRDPIFADLDVVWIAAGKREKSIFRFTGEADGFRYSNNLRTFSRSAVGDGTVTFNTTSSLSPYFGDSMTLQLGDADTNVASISNSSDSWHRISTRSSGRNN
jgi:hypothetical protein